MMVRWGTARNGQNSFVCQLDDMTHSEHPGTATEGTTGSINGCTGTRASLGDVGSDRGKVNSPDLPGGIATCTSNLGWERSIEVTP